MLSLPKRKMPRGWHVVIVTVGGQEWRFATKHSLTPELAAWVLRSKSGAAVGRVSQGGLAFEFCLSGQVGFVLQAAGE